MDVGEYRERYEAEMAKAARRREGAREKRRERAADKPPTTAARAKAITAAPLETGDVAGEVRALLVTLLDRDEPSAVRMAALRALGALDFLGPQFEPFRAEYKQALREVATDPERELRESALDLLASDRDAYAQELLVRGLKEPKEALVSDAKALQLLAYDDHTEVVPLAREVYKRGKGRAREQALRVLSTDPKSAPLLKRLLQDKSEKRSIRRISASGLQSLNPDAFEKTARKIVADESDDDAIRTTSLAALTHGREAREKATDPKLVETVRQVGEKTRSRAMRSSARRFLQSTQE